MLKVINSDELSRLKFVGKIQEYIVSYNDESHSTDSIPILFFYRIDGIDYVISILHADIVEKNKLDDIMRCAKVDIDNTIYCHTYNLANHIGLTNRINASIVNYINDIDIIDIDEWHYKRHYGEKFYNIFLPVLKLYEKVKNLFDNFEYKFNTDIYKYYHKLNNILFDIEKNGIKINKSIYSSLTGVEIDSDIIYSKYNIYTETSRPSNRFNQTHLSSLSNIEKNGIVSKDLIESRFGENGLLVEFDYDSYHIAIIGDILNYSFPKDISIHKHFADLYGVDYNEGKKITFKYLYGYGDIPEEITKINPFFAKIKSLILKLFLEYSRDGYITSFVNNKNYIISFKNKELSKNKVFNYYIQYLETLYNIDIIDKLNTYLNSYNSKLILYNYDSYLIDLNLNEKHILRDIKNIITNNNKFKTKSSIGTSYGKMKRI